MNKFFIFGCFIFVGAFGWRLGERLSPDALGLALGLLFGILAGVPVLLVMLAPARRQSNDIDVPFVRHGRIAPHRQPVVILTDVTNTIDQQPVLPRPEVKWQKYRVVTEEEEWIDDEVEA